MIEVAHLLFGNRVFVGHVQSDLDLVRLAEHGFPITAVDAMVSSGVLNARELHALVISGDELKERRRNEQHLTSEQSDRLLRIARTTALAVDVLGRWDKAGRWLREPNRGLGGEVPLELLVSGEGGRIVEETLMQLGHGIFA